MIRHRSQYFQVSWAVLLMATLQAQSTTKISGSKLLEGLGPPSDILPYGSLISQQCRIDTDNVRKKADLLELWALKILDSNAKPPSGILNGNTNNLGDFDMCMSVEENTSNVNSTYCLVEVDVKLKDKSLQNIDDLIHAHYMLTSNITDPGHRVSKLSQWRWGICVPSSCTPGDITTHLQRLMNQRLSAVGQVQVQVNPAMCYTRHADNDSGYSFGFWITVILYSSIIIGLIFGTVMDAKPSYTASRWTKYLKCFSMKRNWNNLIRKGGEGSDDIPIVHGIRATNAILLLIVHKAMASLYLPYVNPLALYDLLISPLSGTTRGSATYTDSFIFISGVLLAFSLTRTLDREGRLNFKRIYLTRYFRITPSLLFLMLTCTYFIEKIGSGPMWGLVVTKYAQLCRSNMWRNMLYIHSYFGYENMCMTHTHQLGIEMQLFVISPPLLYLLWKKPKLGILTISAICAVSTYLRYSVSKANGLNYYLYYGTSVREIHEMINISYTLPPHRASVYMIGLLTGFGAQRKLQRLRIPRFIFPIGWSFTSIFMIWNFFLPSFFPSKGVMPDAWHGAVYNAASPLLCCSALFWICIACWNDKKGWVYNFLTWKYFTIFSRISYALYLVQFPMYFYRVGTTKASQEFSLFATIINIQEYVTILFFAILLTIFVDMPCQNLRKILFPHADKTN